MNINITARNIELDDALKAYINKRVGKLERLYRRIYKCEVILEEEKIRKNAEVILYLRRNQVIAKESTPDIYASVDNAVEIVKKQLRRLNDRVYSRRRRTVLGRFIRPVTRFRKEAKGRGGRVEVEQGDIVKMNYYADKPMMPEEAKLELDLNDKDFLMYKNAETGEVNVLYKKSDGNYGLVEPNF